MDVYVEVKITWMMKKNTRLKNVQSTDVDF